MKSRTRVFACCLLLAALSRIGVAHSDSTFLTETVTSSSQSNIIFSSNDGRNVAVSFTGSFDFTAIGGSKSPYSGLFNYDTAKPPFSTQHGNPDIATYFFPSQPSSFTVFGKSLTPAGVHLLLQDGTGIFNDFFSFDVSLIPDVPIPGTNFGLSQLNLTAGAFPPNMLTSSSSNKSQRLRDKRPTAGRTGCGREFF